MTPFYLVTNNDDPMRKQVLEINKFLEEFTLSNNLPLIHLQNSFDVLMKTVSRHSISRDDIHLNMAGHMFVQQEIVKQIKTL